MMKEFTFSHVDVKSELVTALKEQLPKNGFKNVKAIKADPQTHAEIPCVGINRADDNESNQTLNDVTGGDFDAQNRIYKSHFGTFFQESLELRVWHTNADERDRLYRMVKALVFAMRMPLAEKGLLNMSIRSGRDEQDTSQAQAPMALYWASLTLSYLNPLDVTFTEEADAISGIDVSVR